MVLSGSARLSIFQSADWITLDLTGLFSVLACWALGLSFGVAGISFGVSASIARAPSERARQTRRALLCAVLAPGFGFLLPLLLSTPNHASAKIIDALTIFWAPVSALLAGLAVHRIGRK